MLKSSCGSCSSSVGHGAGLCTTPGRIVHPSPARTAYVLHSAYMSSERPKRSTAATTCSAVVPGLRPSRHTMSGSSSTGAGGKKYASSLPPPHSFPSRHAPECTWHGIGGVSSLPNAFTLGPPMSSSLMSGQHRACAPSSSSCASRSRQVFPPASTTRDSPSSGRGLSLSATTSEASQRSTGR